jgi:hypothetical protein
MLVSRAARKLIGGYIYSIKLEVNDYCNLRCKMCYVDKLKQDLSDKHIYKLLDSMKGQGIRLEILGGEQDSLYFPLYQWDRGKHGDGQ